MVNSERMPGFSTVGFMYSWGMNSFSQWEPADPSPPLFSSGMAGMLGQLK